METLATFKLGPIQVQDVRQLSTLRPATQAASAVDAMLVCSAVLQHNLFEKHDVLSAT
jgi:hypothetical protein